MGLILKVREHNITSCTSFHTCEVKSYLSLAAVLLWNITIVSMVFISNTRCISSVFLKLTFVCVLCVIVVFIRIVRLIFSANFETPLYCQYYDLMYKRKRTIHADASTFWSNEFKDM